MKNLSTRTKMLLAIVGVVVIVVVAIAFFAQVGGGELLGTAGGLTITPSNPVIIIGETKDLTVNSTYGCVWSSSSASVSFVDLQKEVKTVKVKGESVGSADITAKCGAGLFNVNTATTKVTVNAPTPTPTPPPTRTPGPPPVIAVNPHRSKHSTTIGRNEVLTLCTTERTTMTIASANPADAVLLQVTQPDSTFATCYYVTGQFDGTATIRAVTAAGGTAAVNVTVLYALTMIPAYPYIEYGKSITLGMAGANSSSTWTIDADGTHVGMSLSPTTGQSVTVNAGAAPGGFCTDITSTNPAYGTGFTRVCIQR